MYRSTMGGDRLLSTPTGLCECANSTTMDTASRSLTVGWFERHRLLTMRTTPFPVEAQQVLCHKSSRDLFRGLDLALPTPSPEGGECREQLADCCWCELPLPEPIGVALYAFLEVRRDKLERPQSISCGDVGLTALHLTFGCQKIPYFKQTSSYQPNS